VASRQALRLIALSILVVTASTQPVFLLGAGFLEVGEEFGFGPRGLGVLTGVFFLTASLASAPLGKVVERIGWRRAIRINMVGSATMLVVIAVGARSVWTLAGLLVAAGAFYGFANPAANQALADHIDPRRSALVFGLKHAGIPTSAALAGLAVPVVIVTVGWRWAYVAAVALPLIVALLVPRGHLGLPPSSRLLADPRRSVRPLSSRTLAVLAAGSAMATWAAIALSSYLVAAAVAAGFSEESAGVLLFIGSLTSITSRVAMGALTDRVGGRGFAAIASLTGVGGVVFALLHGAKGGSFAVLVTLAFATAWGWPGLVTYAVVNANRGSAAASSAVTQAGVFVGAGLGPVALGWIVERWSFNAAFAVVAALLALATLTVMAVGRHVAPERSEW
jgi:MFS family permease